MNQIVKKNPHDNTNVHIKKLLPTYTKYCPHSCKLFPNSTNKKYWKIKFKPQTYPNPKLSKAKTKTLMITNSFTFVGLGRDQLVSVELTS